MPATSPMSHRSGFPHWMAALLLLALPVLPAQAQEAKTPPASLDDGPYVFMRADALEAVWVCDGAVVRQRYAKRTGARKVKARCGYPLPLLLAPTPADEARAGNPGGRIVALSDIHGQYDLMVRLLRANGVIDAKNRWKLGRDQLVLTGDVFDRGPRVTEVFWLLQQLQLQARKAGGAVHFLLGNHETMVLYDDLRYVNPKYLRVAEKLGLPYPALYGKDTYLGQWLRGRPVMLRVGDTLFLHGGIAPGNIDLVTGMEATNKAYRDSLGRPKAELKADLRLARLYDGKESPIWYRGYFDGALDTAQVGALLRRLGVARIVVGHTSMKHVSSFHDGRVIAIDSSIKKGESGELLFIENGATSRGMLDGTRLPLAEGKVESDED